MTARFVKNEQKTFLEADHLLRKMHPFLETFNDIQIGGQRNQTLHPMTDEKSKTNLFSINTIIIMNARLYIYFHVNKHCINFTITLRRHEGN